MPRLDGPEVCRRLRAVPSPEPTYVIILTSREGKANAVQALESGADDYVTKPFDRGELAARLRVGRRIVQLQTSETVVYTFAQAVDGKSPYTNGHSLRVKQYAMALASAIGLPAAEVDLVRRAAMLHDIGKIAVPDAILNKPGKLTEEEFAIMRQHPVQGVRMIENIESVRDCIPLVRWHHERMDGKGYPDGLSGESIPEIVRVLGVADVYDALSSNRPYRPALPVEECFRILREDAARGGRDARLVEEFCRLPSEALHRISGVFSLPATRNPMNVVTPAPATGAF